MSARPESILVHPRNVQAVPHTLNVTTLSHVFHDGGTSWKAGSFCEDFLERRYHTSVKVCNDIGTERGPQIRCFWNPANSHAATCDIDNMMIRPDKLLKAMNDVDKSFPHSSSVALLQNNEVTCEKPTISKLVKTIILMFVLNHNTHNNFLLSSSTLVQ